ncbi:amidase domain-containing protein [Micromonospora sp. NPDC049679]|uniref:amidase domain-containing protein n=1 Tax=Micromonospora sp. NPDC049679 TaxID=3155920 RepID=UPI0033E352A0
MSVTLAVLLLGAPPAQAAPDDAALLASAEAYLLNENSLLVDGKVAKGVAALPVAASFRAATGDRLVARTQQRDLDTLADVHFSAVSTKVSAAGPARLDGDRAYLEVNENTDYTFTTPGVDPYGYTVGHQLTFTRSAGVWGLADIKTVDTSGLTAPKRLTDAEYREAQRVTLELKAGLQKAAPTRAAVNAAKTSGNGVFYDYNAMVSWALYYAKDNPVDYTRDTNDCTTFVSFALSKGGWQEVTGFYQNDSAWWYNCDWCAPRHSYTWGGAVNWQRFAYNESRRVTALSNVWYLALADVLQYDVAGYGGVGIPDHTMITTAFSGSTPLLSYHTTDTRNKPLNQILAGAVGQSFWALRT